MRAFTLLAVLFGASSTATLIHTEFPHLLIALKQSQPDTHFDTQFDATVSYLNATGFSKHVEVSFDVPDNEAAICRLNFLINTSAQKNAPYTLSGTAPYALNVSRLQPTINKDTDTWNSRPNVTDYMATYLLTQEGSVSTVFSKWFPCPKGQIAQFLLFPANGERDFEYYWFELDYPEEDGGPHGVVLEMHT